MRLCEAGDAIILKTEGDHLATVAHVGSIPWPHSRRPLKMERTYGKAILERQSVQVEDILTLPPLSNAQQEDRGRTAGIRTVLATPLLQDGHAIGAIFIRRTEVRLFEQRQIALLESFADQAVIAIENARLFEELELRNCDLAESLEQQTATSGVLRAIASSPTDLQAVLDTVAENAARFCDASDVVIRRVDGDELPLVAHYGPIAAAQDLPLSRGVIVGRAVLDRSTVQTADITALPPSEYPARRTQSDFRTILATPLIRDGEAIGVFALRRVQAEAFSDKQVALIEAFADQAVIAIENARLFQELRDRNAELGEALAQQTATAEVLRVIASAPTDLQRVLDTLTEHAARLCDSSDALLHRGEGDVQQLASHYGSLAVPRNRESFSLRDTLIGSRAIREKRPVHVPDAWLLSDDMARVREQAAATGWRTMLLAPLLRQGSPIGIFALRRTEARPFTEAQISLLETFADQAVIAIENARLFGELQNRTAELAELNSTLESRVASQVDELERVGRLRRYLSPQLSELIVSSGDESILETHRRQITVVFCDLRGFTAFAETAEPEEVTGVLAEYHAAMGELVREFEGTLDRFAGDGMMVFFNDPLPQPDHAERAVQMACAMRDRAEALAIGWRKAGYELAFGVGIAVGYATLGRVGFEGRYDYTAIGTVANQASRLCDEAAGGQILVSGRLQGMVEDFVDAEPAGELSLKGFHRPVAAFNVLRLRNEAEANAVSQ
jgi:class 3 adenylate cyclase/putative methionine-R-sulfoxide reductase with GAF domain